MFVTSELTQRSVHRVPCRKFGGFVAKRQENSIRFEMCVSKSRSSTPTRWVGTLATQTVNLSSPLHWHCKIMLSLLCNWIVGSFRLKPARDIVQYIASNVMHFSLLLWKQTHRISTWSPTFVNRNNNKRKQLTHLSGSCGNKGLLTHCHCQRSYVWVTLAFNKLN